MVSDDVVFVEAPYRTARLADRLRIEERAEGSIRSIYDKELNKELVDAQSSLRFGQYLYVTGGDEEPNSILQYRAVSLKPEVYPHASKDGVISVERRPGAGARSLRPHGKHGADS